MRRTYLLCLAGAALVAVLAVILTNLDPAVAQAAPPQREPQPYQFWGMCAGQPCSLTLPAIPLDKRLVIQNVSLVVSGPTGAQPHVNLEVTWTGAAGPSSTKNHYLPLIYAGAESNTVYYRGNHQILAFADAGSQPKLHLGGVGSTPPSFLAASVSGYLEPL
jgi:hypothetical protein